MNAFLYQLTSLLTETPGNIIYHLALAFSIASAFQVAFGHWRTSQFPQVKRTLLGLFVLLMGQIFLFLVSAIAWQALINPAMVLPPLDRAIAFFSLIWIAWLWNFPEPNRPADAGIGLLSLLVFAGLALSIAAWMPLAAPDAYNATFQDTLWQLFSLAFIFTAGVGLFIRRPNGWNHGLIFMGFAFLGHGLHLTLGSGSGNFSGIVRLFYLAAYPILLTLPQRFPFPTSVTRQNLPNADDQTDRPTHERRRYSTDPKTVHALLALASELEVSKSNHAITRVVAQTMLADLCFLIYLSEDTKEMIIVSGYDLIREENLEGSSLNKEVIPMLANAIQRGRPLRLPQSSTSPDLQGLGEILGLSNPGHLLSTPILKEVKEPIGCLLLLSPYSNRLWNGDDQAFLGNISASLVPIIQRGQILSDIQYKSDRNQELAEELRVQIEGLRNEKNALETKLEKIENGETNIQDQKDSMEALVAIQDEAKQEILLLQKEIEALNARNLAQKEENNKIGIKGDTDDKQIQKELETALEEAEHLQNALAKAKLKITDLEKGSMREDTDEQAEVIISISQELRQPLSSIVGYTDLLLGESVGILGALQRQFVDRIKASVERVGNLIDDIIQVNSLEISSANLKSEPVDLNIIIDNAMAYTSSQVREKNISINLELPKVLQPIHTDKDAIQQILIHLIQNAGAASPVDGTITLGVKNHKEKDQEYILIQVADTGGGIPAEDMPRIFSRLYRAENILIQGVGDTGVGLSIAKTLTEAQHGRIWVDSEENVGATFSLILPISPSNGDEN